MELSDVKPDKNSTSADEIPTTTGEQTSTAPGETTTQANVDVEANDERGTLCSVCLERPRNVRLPCGHGALCQECAVSLLNTTQLCPTCRAPFTKYYKSDLRTIRNQGSFLDPKTATESFGTLQSLATGEWFKRQANREAMRAGGLVKVICAVLALLVIFALALSPLALIVFESWLYHTRKHAPCDEPLAEVLLGILILQCVQLFRNALAKSCARRGFKFLAAFFVMSSAIAGLVMFSFAAHYAYASKQCDRLLQNYMWWLVTIVFCVLGFCTSLACCACMVAVAVRRH